MGFPSGRQVPRARAKTPSQVANRPNPPSAATAAARAASFGAAASACGAEAGGASSGGRRRGAIRSFRELAGGVRAGSQHLASRGESIADELGAIALAGELDGEGDDVCV